MDDISLARWRLHTLRLSGQVYESAEEAIGGMLGVQAENYSQTVWAIASRAPTTGATSFHRSFDEGRFLRTHVLRPTWHFVQPADIGWLIALTGDRIKRSMAQLRRAYEIDDRDLAASREIIADILGDGVHRTREDLATDFAARGHTMEGREIALLAMDAEASGLICSGFLKDGEHTYALIEDRAPEARRMDRDEAVDEIVHRYFAGHGPATERDLSYWASMTLTDIRRGLANVAPRLDRIDHDGKTFWFAEPPPDDLAATPRGHLLLALDEFHNGYQASRAVLDVAGIVPKGRAANVGMALVDGQMVGGMKRTVGPSTVSFEVNLFRHLVADELAALRDAAARYGLFLDLEPLLEVIPPV